MTQADAISEDRKRQIQAFMADIENEYIDKSEWLPRKSSLINKDRAAKPDIVVEMDCPECKGAGAVAGHRCYRCKGNKRVEDGRWRNGVAATGEIQHARVDVRRILNWLYDEGHIGSKDLDAAFSYHVWRDYFAAMWAGKQSDSCWYEVKDAFLAGDPITERKFSILLQRLTRNDQRLIDYAVDTTASGHTVWLVSQQAGHYKDAFARLSQMVQWVINYPLTEPLPSANVKKE